MTKRKAGRPVGSRSKNTLNKAIKRFEALQLDAADVIINIALGNEEFFDDREIKIAERMSAAKYIITAPAQMKKDNGLGDKSNEGSSSTAEEEEDTEEIKPLIVVHQS